MLPLPALHAPGPVSEAAVQPPESPDEPRPFWKRLIIDPVLAQLKQGLTPDRIALTIAVGSAIAMFPILGTTTLICLIVGVFMKLNQPIIQAVNYACTPIHLPFIWLSMKWGERLFEVKHSRLEFSVMRKLLMEDPLKFVTEYGQTAFHAIVVWAILVPFWMLAIYYSTLPILREFARLRAEKAARAAAKAEPDHPPTP